MAGSGVIQPTWSAGAPAGSPSGVEPSTAAPSATTPGGGLVDGSTIVWKSNTQATGTAVNAAPIWIARPGRAASPELRRIGFSSSRYVSAAGTAARATTIKPLAPDRGPNSSSATTSSGQCQR